MKDKEPRPIDKARNVYQRRLELDMINDYKSLDLCYDLINQISEKEIGLEYIDQYLKLFHQVNVIHERIRKRLHY